jgi:hypothetical protein
VQVVPEAAQAASRSRSDWGALEVLEEFRVVARKTMTAGLRARVEVRPVGQDQTLALPSDRRVVCRLSERELQDRRFTRVVLPDQHRVTVGNGEREVFGESAIPGDASIESKWHEA